MLRADPDFRLRVLQIRLAYRLFNYVAILLGAMPPAAQRDTPEAEAHVIRTARMFEAAGRHSIGASAPSFFALDYLGWFVSAWVLFITTAAVVIVIWRRQFASKCLARNGELGLPARAMH